MIYICGDSFGVSDPEHGTAWMDILAQRFPVTNLCEVAATNLLISRQVDQALAAKADFVIVLCTAVTRGEKKVGNRYQPFSYHTASMENTQFTPAQLRILKEYYTEFFDLDLAIYQNAITIEHTLNRIRSQGVRFLFDQGGFENPQFGSVGQHYFAEFQDHRSEINLWDLVDRRIYRPYYHIVDAMAHQQVADYYTQQIQAK